MIRTVHVAPEWTPSPSSVEAAGTETELRSQRRAVQAWTAALILLCAGTLWLQSSSGRHRSRLLVCLSNTLNDLSRPARAVDRPALFRSFLEITERGYRQHVLCHAGPCRVPARHQAALDPPVRTDPRLVRWFAAGSKYTSGLVAIPILLVILIHVKAGHKIWACLAAIATMIAAFLVVVPYSLLDVPTFLNGLAFDARHYAEGHIGKDGEPGLPQLLFYGRHFLSDFGVGADILAVIGAITYCAADWRRATIIVSFPVGLMWLLAAHRVHFPRNVLNLYSIVAMFLVHGIVSVHGWYWGWPRDAGGGCS